MSVIEIFILSIFAIGGVGIIICFAKIISEEIALKRYNKSIEILDHCGSCKYFHISETEMNKDVPKFICDKKINENFSTCEEYEKLWSSLIGK